MTDDEALAAELRRLRRDQEEPLEPKLMSPSLDFGVETLEVRIAAAIEINEPIDPKQVVNYNREDYAIEDVPWVMGRAMLGYGHDAVDIARRDHLTRPDNKPWAWTPETCLVASGHRGVWIDSAHLCCPGCGLDFT